MKTNNTMQLNHNSSVRASLIVSVLLVLSSLALYGQTPTIKSVSTVKNSQWQTITIKGTNLGTQAPYIGNSAYIALDDSTAIWTAGFDGNVTDPACAVTAGSTNLITLIVDYWSETEIVLGGFSADYGEGGWELNANDDLTVCVWNPQSGDGPAMKTVLVH